MAAEKVEESAAGRGLKPMTASTTRGQERFADVTPYVRPQHAKMTRTADREAARHEKSRWEE